MVPGCLWRLGDTRPHLSAPLRPLCDHNRCDTSSTTVSQDHARPCSFGHRQGSSHQRSVKTSDDTNMMMGAHAARILTRTTTRKTERISTNPVRTCTDRIPQADHIRGILPKHFGTICKPASRDAKLSA
jgi:hypothetical protein